MVVATNNEPKEDNIIKSKETQKFILTYISTDDLSIKEIYDNGEYKIKTFGGDVIVTINGIQYSFEEALQQGLITGDEIVEQAKIDAESGICVSSMFYDGGSTEYKYPNYTVLKLNDLQYDTQTTDKDLVIGMEGSFISLYSKEK